MYISVLVLPCRHKLIIFIGCLFSLNFICGIFFVHSVEDREHNLFNQIK